MFDCDGQCVLHEQCLVSTACAMTCLAGSQRFNQLYNLKKSGRNFAEATGSQNLATGRRISLRAWTRGFKIYGLKLALFLSLTKNTTLDRVIV